MIVEYVKQLALGVRFIVNGSCKMTYTTLKDFELFKRECNRWIDRLGLHDWEFTFLHIKLDSGANADCTSYAVDKMMTIRLSKTIELQDRNKREQIKNSAQHEVLHALLEDIYHQAIDRGFCHNDYLMAEHVLIHRLQKAFGE